MMAAMLWFGVTATVIIPYNVKYKNVRYMKRRYHRNLLTVQSNPIMAYTITPYITACIKM